MELRVDTLRPGFVGYGTAYATRVYRVTELSLPFGRPLQVAHLSDIHAGLHLTRNAIKDYASLANALQPDLFVLTGDFISNSMSFLYGCAEELARVRSRYGCRFRNFSGQVIL